jgi:hypothetical protein
MRDLRVGRVIANARGGRDISTFVTNVSKGPILLQKSLLPMGGLPSR